MILPYLNINENLCTYVTNCLKLFFLYIFFNMVVILIVNVGFENEDKVVVAYEIYYVCV